MGGFKSMNLSVKTFHNYNRRYKSNLPTSFQILISLKNYMIFYLSEMLHQKKLGNPNHLKILMHLCWLRN